VSTDVVEDLYRVYKGALPPDMTAEGLARNLAYTIAEVMAVAEAEAARLARNARVGTAISPAIELHARSNHGLRRQSNESVEQLRTRLQRPPSAVTRGAILEAIESIVAGAYRATLDFLTVTGGTGWDTILEAIEPGQDGNLLTLRAIAGSQTIFSEAGTAITVTFNEGVDTVESIERLINENSSLVRLRAPSTIPDYEPVSSDDEFGPSAFSGGLDPPPCFLIELPLHGAFYDTFSFYDTPEARWGGGRGVVIAVIPDTASAKSSVSDALRSKVAAGKIWFVQEYTA
jgi:hypothetical protein